MIPNSLVVITSKFQNSFQTWIYIAKESHNYLIFQLNHPKERLWFSLVVGKIPTNAWPTEDMQPMAFFFVKLILTILNGPWCEFGLIMGIILLLKFVSLQCCILVFSQIEKNSGTTSQHQLWIKLSQHQLAIKLQTLGHGVVQVTPSPFIFETICYSDAIKGTFGRICVRRKPKSSTTPTSSSSWPNGSSLKFGTILRSFDRALTFQSSRVMDWVLRGYRILHQKFKAQILWEWSMTIRVILIRPMKSFFLHFNSFRFHLGNRVRLNHI